MLVARVAWLDWPTQWCGGRVVWTDGQRTLSPSVDDLAAAVRCLNKIPAYPIAARAVLGDVDPWIERKRLRIELVRRLRKVDVDAAVDSPSAWAEALVAQAMALNHCPTSPAAELVRAGSVAMPHLTALLNGSHLPADVHRLAWLVIGAIDRRTHAGDVDHAKIDNWCYRYGFQFGVPTNIRAALALLARGFDVAIRYDTVKISQRTFALPAADLDRLIDEGVYPEAVVEIAEALVDAESIASEIRRMPVDTGARLHRGTKAYLKLATFYGIHADQLVGQVRDIFHRCSLKFRTLEATRAAMSLIAALLDAPYTGNDRLRNMSDLFSFANRILTAAESLPSSLFADLIQWVASCHRYPDQSSELVIRAGIKLASRCKSMELVRRAYSLNALDKLKAVEWTTADVFETVIDIAEKLGAACAEPLIDIASQSRSGSAAKANLPLLARHLKILDDEARTIVLDALKWERWKSGLTIDEYLALVAPLTPCLALDPSDFSEMQAETRSEWAETITECLIRIACMLRPKPVDTIKAELHWAREHMIGLIPVTTPGRLDDSIDIARRLVSLMKQPSSMRVREIIKASAGRRFDSYGDNVDDGFEFVGKQPIIAYVVSHNFIRQPQRCLNIVAAMSVFHTVVPVVSRIFESVRLIEYPRVSASDKYKPDVIPPPVDSGPACFVSIAEYLGYPTGQEVEAAFEPEAADCDKAEIECFAAPTSYLDTGLTPIAPDSSWYRLRAQFPELDPGVVEYLQLAAIAGIPLHMPKSLRKIVERRERAAKEIAYLTTAITENPQNDGLLKRLVRCQAQLNSDMEERHGRLAEVTQAIDNLVADVQLAAVESLINRVYRRHLITIAGPDLADEVPALVSADLRNAVALAASIRRNRKLLIRLIRSCLSGDDSWRERHPANVEILSKLANAGVDAALWLSDFPRRYRCPDIEGGWVYLRVEKDALRILQMGNSFNTCLSRGGINAFSTVANACELNKRVIFGYDANGRIVARKLIGLNDELGLLGYHAYTNDSRGHGSAALRNVVNQYARTFADACGIQLANSGAIPKLFAQAWYDDGYHTWEEREPVVATSNGSAAGLEGRIPPFGGCPDEAMQGTITT